MQISGGGIPTSARIARREATLLPAARPTAFDVETILEVGWELVRPSEGPQRRVLFRE